VIAGLKIADLRVAAGRANVFRGARNRNGGDRLVVGLDDDSLFPNVPQYPGECSRVRLTPLHRTTRAPLLWIPPAGVSSTGISHAWNDDLAKAGNAGQQENGQ
jgi:hypothetical protein